jgi:hypothetical protein
VIDFGFHTNTGLLSTQIKETPKEKAISKFPCYKAMPVQAWRGFGNSKRLRLPDFQRVET